MVTGEHEEKVKQETGMHIHVLHNFFMYFM